MSGRERWERERDRYYEQDRYEDDRYYMRGGRGDSRSSYDDDRVYYDYEHGRRRGSGADYERRVVMEKERERDDFRSPARPGYHRRQSSLDTHDRRPLRGFYDREEYPPPARREDIHRDDFRAPPYQDIPLPPSRRVADRYREDYYNMPPERTYEREVIRSRDREERDRSRDSHTTRTSKSRTHRSHSKTSRSSSSSSSSSSTSRGGTTVVSEYPKKGKTRVPVRLISKRALIDLEYPYVEEGNTIVIQKALGQENIDELLKLSEDYKRSEEEVAAARSSAGDVEEREKVKEEFVLPPPAPAPAPPPPASVAPPPTAVPPPPASVAPPPQPAPVVVDATPRGVEFVEYDRTVYRDSSPSRSSSAHYHHHHHHHDDEGAMVVRSRSHSRSRKDIRAEIKALERQLHHRPRGEVTERFAERMPNGELIVYEETVENIKAPHKPPRIEKDKKGRMSISLPKFR